MNYSHRFSIIFKNCSDNMINEKATKEIHPKIKKWQQHERFNPDLYLMDKVATFLDRKRISFHSPDLLPEFLIDIVDSNPAYDEFMEMITNLKETEGVKKVWEYMVTPIYAKEEFLNAEWLRVESIFTAAETEDKGIVNWDRCPQHQRMVWPASDSEEDCIKKVIDLRFPAVPTHIELIRPFYLTKGINWRNKFFASCGSFQESALLCSKMAKEIMEDNLKGVKFLPTFDSQGKNQRPDIFQLVPVDTLSEKAFTAVANARSVRCESCGMDIFQRSNSPFPIKFGVCRQFMSKNVDFYMTLPCIDEYNYGYSTSIIVMSQKAYQFLTEKQMTRALKIEPLETI